MANFISVVILVVATVPIKTQSASVPGDQQYNSSWASLDSRPNPAWWSEFKFGVSLHWGVYSVPSFSASDQPFAEWYWHNMGGPTGPDNGSTGRFHQRVYHNATYADFAPSFRAELYNQGLDWASLFDETNVQAAILTSKHHDGFELWPSDQSYNWNSVAIGPRADLVGQFMSAMQTKNITAGLYHSVFEWFNPLYRGPNPSSYVTDKLIPDLHDIVNTYKPAMLLMDGEWEQPSDFWQTRPFLEWLFNDSPIKDTVVIDDRWGNECRGHHGGVYICENGGFSDFCNGGGTSKGTTHAWAYWATQARSWGFSRTESSTEYKGASFFVPLLVQTVVNNGALILNLGPAADGTIPAQQEEIVRAVGSWLDVNKEAIFNTTYKNGTRQELLDSYSDTCEKNMNNVYGAVAGKDYNNMNFLGVADSCDTCQAMCSKASSCFSYTWHNATVQGYLNMCYGRNDTQWSLVPEAGHYSGKRMSVQYTVSTVEEKTLYALFNLWPSNRTIHLTVPYTTPNSKATLLGVEGELKIQSTGKQGAVVTLPDLSVDELPCDYMYAIKLTDSL
eukprot:m.343036 g.343036  ORF g.343036 m.343036 type:complete len:560 (-) comp22241_c0_seq1:58-1737(-)